MGENFSLIEDFLQYTKYKDNSYPCIKGCHREIREIGEQYYAICTLEPENCTRITIAEEAIQLLSFNARKFTDYLLTKLTSLPLTESVSLVANDSLTYHIAEYDETDEFSRKLYIYLSILPWALTSFDMVALFDQHKDFFVLMLGRAAPNLANAGHKFSERVLNISRMLINDEIDELLLSKRFSEILSKPVVPIFSDKAVKLHDTGLTQSLKQQATAQLGIKERQYSSQSAKAAVEKIALPKVEERPGYYTASRLALITAQHLKFDRKANTIRKDLGQNEKIKPLLKPHRSNKAKR